MSIFIYKNGGTFPQLPPLPCYLREFFFIWTCCYSGSPIKTPLHLFSPSFYTPPPNPFSGIEQWLYLEPGSLSLTQGRDM